MVDILDRIFPHPRETALTLLDDGVIPLESQRLAFAATQLREMELSGEFALCTSEGRYRITALVLFLDQMREKAEEREATERSRRRSQRWGRYGRV